MHTAHDPAPETTPLEPSPRPPITAPRRAAEVAVLAVCVLLFLRHWGVEPYAVPTGSMAPALAGHHRTRTCPRCGYPVLVGRRPADRGAGNAAYRLYRGAHCLNCGLTGLDMHAAAEARGDQLLVNRSVFAFRAPRRWEMVVFRLFGITFVKRLIGLPDELVELCDGDVFINDELERKTLAQARTLCIPVFDNDFQPEPGGWQERWEVAADHSGPHPLAGAELRLDGEASTERYQTVTYRHYQLDTKQCEPIRDEYGYNGGERTPALAHDFLMTGSLEVGRGEGAVLLGITDGKDRLVAEVPVGRAGEARLSRADARPPQSGDGTALVQAARGVHLKPGQPYRVELAFVDRRVTLALDGTPVLGPVDLPAVSGRPGVTRPVVLGVRGVRLVVRNFRLARDIHYTSAGRNAGPGQAVRLGHDQYFVLGDNSPNSQDSRFWPDGGAVPAGSLLGKPFVVHLPGRVTGGDAGTRAVRGMDWGRVRWLR